MFAAARTLQFQSPPHFRPGPAELLLLRQPASEGQADTWRFPRLGEFEHPGDSEPWTETTELVRLDARFELPGGPSADYFWCPWTFASGISPTAYHPDVPPALERFAREKKLDQILRRVDSAFNFKSGDIQVSTDIQRMQRQLDALQRQVGPPDGDPREFRQAQARADSVYQQYGDSAPPPLAGEQLHAYRVRLVSPYLKHSAKLKNANLAKIHDTNALDVIEQQIYLDAAREAVHPTGGFRPGELRAIVTMDAANRPVTRYVGDQNACWSQFNPPIRHVRRFHTAAR